MGRTNDKTDVDPAMLRDLSERISNCARKFDDVSVQMEAKQIKTLALALDTFKSVALDRLEAFSRTIEREFIRATDTPKASKPPEDIEVAAKKIDEFSTQVGRSKKLSPKKEPNKNKAQAKKRGSA